MDYRAIDWRAELAAVSEGFCPYHESHLTPQGWCMYCEAWWFADCDKQMVGRRWPPPEAVITGYRDDRC